MTSKHLPLIEEAAYGEMKKGLYCPDCLRFYLKRTRQTVSCACGYTELLHEAVKRAIEDYAILFHHKDLVKSEIRDFLNHEVSNNTIYRVLKKNYEQIKKNRYTSYLNPHKIMG